MAVSEQGAAATAAVATPSRSTHVADAALAPFLQPQFDPADYLNATLPALSISSVSARPLKSGQAASLADVSSQTQDLLSQLNAHTTRLSAILTQLTDDILRSGGRLAYEVEVLRGETIGLTETLTEGLQDEVDKFLPGGVSLDAKTTHAPPEQKEGPAAQSQPQQDKGTEHGTAAAPPPSSTTPEYISQLRVLSLVRTRLETVIKVFGEAMHWSLPPSEVSLASSLISVSGPEPGSDAQSREQKGKEFAASLRSEISDLITGDPINGADAAAVRIQALRDLAQVWKGTVEEKPRAKFVDALVRLAEEKQRAVEDERSRRQRQQQQQRQSRTGSVPRSDPPPQQQQQQQQRAVGGFLDNLQRIRGNFT
ncbi:hypothetical protein BS50DRAFT_563066 [Corynespora cassiicola Philippines]|uniref:Uncharacterized protein n=1 Tax=Corynespora cassiicola Philippines TaxID=1448308 RepID=A0A2T2N6B9_CORCC|nr:hypothetical protein BS50DRAFT_563066 [Corynespora cassiicola Philippines]